MNCKNTFFKQKLTWNVNGRLVDFSTPRVMGIVNLTPDSYYDGGKYSTISDVLKRCATILEEGVSIIDIGGYSSRPGAEHISQEEENQRILPAIKAIVKEFPKAIISIDTFRASTAELAIQEGATIDNDISAGELDKKMFSTVAKLKVPYILMHMRGTPQTMVSQVDYQDLLGDMMNYFIQKIKSLQESGVVDLMIDPGFGFAKTIEQNYSLLAHLNLLKTLEQPIMVGLSRKSMIYNALNTSSSMALNGTIAANTVALLNGANLLRVHDVKPAMETIKILSMLAKL